MKIQSQGGSSLVLTGKQTQIVCNPFSAPSGALDFVTLSQPGETTAVEAKKLFNTPGEFEVSGILAQGFFTDDRTNIAYKAVIDDVAVLHFGNAKEVPGADFFEAVGENIDIVALALNPDFDDKKAKALIDKVDPRMALILGDAQFFPKMVENSGAKTPEETPLNVSRSSLSDDKTEVIILAE